MSNDKEEKIAMQRFQEYYRDTLLDTNAKLDMDRFIYPEIRTSLTSLYSHGITSLSQKLLFSQIQKTNSTHVMQWYWRLHTKSYLDRLKTLTKQLPAAIHTIQTKAIIIIAAMNELETEKAIASAKKGYSGDFEKEIVVIIYHNYKKEPDTEVMDAMKKLEKRKNVFVVHEQVALSHNVTMAKKTATDLVQYYLDDSIDIPYIFLDADVVLLTEGVVNATIAALSDPGILAVSPQYDYDPAMKSRFPVLGLVWDIDKSMRISLAKRGTYSPVALGFYIGISRKVLAMIGGIKVLTATQRNTISPLHMNEDLRLTYELFRLVGYDEYGFLGFWGKNPIVALHEANHTIYVNASRELYDLLQGYPWNYRWSSTNYDYYPNISGTKRLVLSEKATYHHIPELSEATSQHLTKALNTYYKSTYTVEVIPPQEMPTISRELLTVLRSFDLATTFSAVHSTDMDRVNIVDDGEESRSLIFSANGWQIAEFLTVNKITR